MAKKPITIDELAAMTQRGFADTEQRIGTRMDAQFGDVKALMHDMLEELTATHADVRHVKSTVDVLARSDSAQDAAITDLTARVQRLERKAGLAK